MRGRDVDSTAVRQCRDDAAMGLGTGVGSDEQLGGKKKREEMRT